MRQTTEPLVRIYEYGDWMAVYVNGQLVHWHDTPSRGKLLRLAGVTCVDEDLPDEFAKLVEQGGHDANWSPPATLVEFQEKLRDLRVAAIGEDISAMQAKLQELKKLQKDVADGRVQP